MLQTLKNLPITIKIIGILVLLVLIAIILISALSLQTRSETVSTPTLTTEQKQSIVDIVNKIKTYYQQKYTTP